MRTFQEIEKELSDIGNLPTISVVASKLLDLLVDNNIAMGKISELMQHDPAITAKILKIVNSAYYGVRKEVDTLKMALVLLGINEISNIIMSLSLFRGFDLHNEGSEGFDREAFWEHSAITAYIAQHISKRIGLRVHGEEFTAGLLHDLGKIIMDQYYHEDFVNINKFMEEHRFRSVETEKIIFGVTHSEIGAWLIKKWKLPDKLVNIIKYHHNVEEAETDREIVALIAISDLLAHHMVDYQTDIYGSIDVKETAAWKILEFKLGQIKLDDLKEELKSTVEKAKTFIKSATKA